MVDIKNKHVLFDAARSKDTTASLIHSPTAMHFDCDNSFTSHTTTKRPSTIIFPEIGLRVKVYPRDSLFMRAKRWHAADPCFADRDALVIYQSEAVIKV